MIPTEQFQGSSCLQGPPLWILCDRGFHGTPVWSSGSDIPGLTRPLVPCSGLTWPRETGMSKRGAFDLKKAVAFAKSPRRLRLAQAQASPSEGSPF